MWFDSHFCPLYFHRGKESGHDVDLLLSHPEEGKEPGLLARLLSRLHNMGLVLYGNHENSTFTESVLRTDSKLHGLKGQLDHFEKWIGVLKVDKSFRKKDNDCCEVSTSNEGHFSSRETSWKAKNEEFSWNARRVDLIVVPHSQYYYALVGWIGSKHFNRSLRLYAQRELNMKLSSHGLYDNNTVSWISWFSILFCCIILECISFEFFSFLVALNEWVWLAITLCPLSSSLLLLSSAWTFWVFRLLSNRCTYLLQILCGCSLVGPLLFC